jgi:FkbM family methyltransferase
MSSMNSSPADMSTNLPNPDGPSTPSIQHEHPSPMRRTPSHLAQFAFSVFNNLEFLASHGRPPLKKLARIAQRLTSRIANSLGSRYLVTARVYGRELLMPANFALPQYLVTHPRYNRPLALAAQSVAECSERNSRFVLIDVGANIGDTVAIVEQRCPGIGYYLCIEPDGELAALSRVNHSGNSRVQVEQHFVGESEGAMVALEDDGHSNPSVKLVGDRDNPSRSGRIIRLDTVASSFVQSHGTLSLIKVDTEGYDFSILRSGSNILRQYSPALYFEWFPKLLAGLGEESWEGFDYLVSQGYKYYVLFTNYGDYYCSLTAPDRSLLNVLAGVTVHYNSPVYFDVFATKDRLVCQRLEELSLQDMCQGES